MQRTKKTLKPKQEDLNVLVRFLFMLQLTNKMYHWSTSTYSRHMASDRFNTSLLELTDRFVETYIGKFNMTPQFSSVPIAVNMMTDDAIIELFWSAKSMLEELEQFTHDSELLAIRDDLLAHVEQTIYLFRFQ
jgi:hypothetical protein